VCVDEAELREPDLLEDLAVRLGRDPEVVEDARVAGRGLDRPRDRRSLALRLLDVPQEAELR